MKGSSSCHAQRSLDGFDDLRIHFHSRIERAQLIVKNLSYQRRMTKDASGHGHRDRCAVSLREESSDHRRGYISEFPSRVREDLPGHIVVASGYCRKKCGKVRRRNRVGGAHKIDQRAYAPDFAERGG